MRYYQCGKYPIEFVLSENIDKHFDSHNHVGHYVISMVMQGTVTLCLENREVVCRRGDVFLTHETQLETHEVIKGSGKCVNAGSTIPYEPGTISIMQVGVPHEVTAGSEGLYLFAKFMPALC